MEMNIILFFLNRTGLFCHRLILKFNKICMIQSMFHVIYLIPLELTYCPKNIFCAIKRCWEKTFLINFQLTTEFLRRKHISFDKIKSKSGTNFNCQSKHDILYCTVNVFHNLNDRTIFFSFRVLIINFYFFFDFNLDRIILIWFGLA